MYILQIILIIIQTIIYLNSVVTQFNTTCNHSHACLTSLTQSFCSANGTFMEFDPIKTNTCCPTCRGGKGRNEQDCDTDNPDLLCAPGLRCESVCALDRELCTYTYHLTELQGLPTCNYDGTFAAKQCRGDRVTGRCFCYDEYGSRIFGWNWWKDSDHMTCACSRHRSNLERNGRIDVTLHCDQTGSYEELQCDSGICWCANPNTGRIINGTRAVPQSMWTTLPCYDFNKMGSQYLRECESAAHAQNLIRKSLGNRGTSEVSFNNVQCDYDGSYGTYNIVNGIAACIWRDGTRIGSFQANSNTVAAMNCNCARDQKYFEENGFTLSLSCEGNGNYQSVQDQNGLIFCVDRDGFAVSEFFDTVTGLDCTQYFYYMQI